MMLWRVAAWVVSALVIGVLGLAPAPVGAQADRLGRLNWGPWTAESLRAHLASAPDDDLSRQTHRVLQVAEQQLGTPITPVAHISVEGVLSTDPAYRASAAATAQLD